MNSFSNPRKDVISEWKIGYTSGRRILYNYICTYFESTFNYHQHALDLTTNSELQAIVQKPFREGMTLADNTRTSAS